MLENFAGTSAPTKKIAGQIWYDSGTKKLKFFDGIIFRTTGGAEIAPSNQPPSGLTVGDFWYDTTTKQVKVWNGNDFTLVGPQAVANVGVTQMRSRSVLDNTSNPHPIVEAVINDVTIYVISKDDFTLPATGPNSIAGFSRIRQGITISGADNPTEGVSTTYKYQGTASNADRLGGVAASNFVRSDQSSSFATLARFSDAGYTVGASDVLHVYIDSGVPTVANELSDTIAFKTTSGSVQTPLVLKGANILPGVNNNTNIGSGTLKFATMYATSFNGTATQASALMVNANAVAPSITVPGAGDKTTVPVRDSMGDIYARVFNGIASQARYADLAEKYLADQDYEVGTVVIIGGPQEVTACGRTPNQRAIGVVSDKPAYLMNKDLENGTAIALKGRVPVKVVGSVHKGAELIAATGPDNLGCAVANSQSPSGYLVFAIALEDNYDEEIKVVEALIL